MITRRSVRVALVLGAAVVFMFAAGSAPALATTALPEQSASGVCAVKLTYGEARISYSSQASIFGADTHVAMSTTGDGFVLVFDHLYAAGQPTLRGLTGMVTAPRGWNAHTGWLPAHASFGVVSANNGLVKGSCRT